MGTGNEIEIVEVIARNSFNFFFVGQCSLSCNGGIQRRNSYCMSDSNGVKINEKFCVHMAKEILERTCNNEDCPTWTYTADAPVL